MRKFLAALAFLAFPITTFAAPISWDFSASTNILQPLQSAWSALVKANRFQATSTSQASTFPYASTTALSSSNLTSGNCVQASTGGLLTSTGNPCATGTLTQINTTFPITGGPITTTGTITFGGLSTSTPAVIGNLPYFSGVNTFANVATTSASCSGAISCTAFTVIGSSPITISGTGGSSYPFPLAGNATSTLTQFNGGLTAFASSTIGNGILGLVINGSATTTGNLLVQGNATSTNFFAMTASTTSLFGANISGFGLSNCTGTNALTFSGTNFSCTAQAQGTVTAISVATANGFTGSSSGGATPQLTLTTNQSGLLTGNGTAITGISGNTGWFPYYSSATAITATSSLFIATSGNIGIGTTTPWAKLSIGSANATNPLIPLFVVASSSLNVGTSTLFIITGDGKVGIASTTPAFPLSINNSGSDFYVTTGGQAVGQDSTNSWKGRISPTRFGIISTATTTTWTATTSEPYVIAGGMVAPFTGVLQGVRCMASTTAAFLGVSIYINQTKITPSYFIASTTANYITVSGNNTFTAGNFISMYVGSSTPSSANLGVSCTVYGTETP